MSRIHWVCVAACWSLVASPLFAQDKVLASKGVPVQGTIIDFRNMTELTVDVGGVSRKFPVNELARVTFEEEPAELQKAKEAAHNGQFEAALADLKTIAEASLAKRDAVRMEYDFYKALCEAKLALAGGGNPKTAYDTNLAFGGTWKANFHTLETMELLGQLAMSQSDWANATNWYGRLEKAAPWPEHKMRATTALARALVAQRNFAEAQQRYDAVIASTEQGGEALRQKLLAQVGKALCMAELGAPDQAQKAIENIIKNQDSKDTALFGRAYNALGICYLRQKKPKDARLAFLHTDLLFFSDPDAHAEALYYLSKLWNDEGKADRAVQARSTLQNRYSGSRWNAAASAN